MINESKKQKTYFLIFLKWGIYFIIAFFLLILIPISISVFYQSMRTVPAPNLMKINNIQEIKENIQNYDFRKKSLKESSKSNSSESDSATSESKNISAENSEKMSAQITQKDIPTSDSISINENIFIPIDDSLSPKQKEIAEKINENYMSLLKILLVDWENIKKIEHDPDDEKYNKKAREIYLQYFINDEFITDNLKEYFDLTLQQKWNDTLISLCAEQNDIGLIIDHCRFVETRFDNWDKMIYYCNQKGPIISTLNIGIAILSFEITELRNKKKN